jgi:hypothetical protein
MPCLYSRQTHNPPSRADLRESRAGPLSSTLAIKEYRIVKRDPNKATQQNG